MDPLSPFVRNEPCWCGSDRKYKRCHGNHRPPSAPGEPVPGDDDDGSFFISPTLKIAKDALSVPESGLLFHEPTGKPEARPVYVDLLAQQVAARESARDATDSMALESLARLRLDLFQQLRKKLTKDAAPPAHDLRTAIIETSAATVSTVGDLARRRPKPVMLWNEEIDPARFIGRTLLLADHVLVPDPVFHAVSHDADPDRLRQAVDKLLAMGPLIQTGHVIPVPPTVAQAIAGDATVGLTKQDTGNVSLVEWVRSQLIVEGPTAREALIFRAIDDTDPHGYGRYLGRRVASDPDARVITTKLFGRYDPSTDYGPWIRQSFDDAVSHFIQRLNERVVVGDVFGAEYVTASPFEARMLRRKQHHFAHAAEAAIWAQVPVLPDAQPNALARALRNDSAVEDLRAQLRAALAAARDLGSRSEALTSRAAELEAASHALERTIRSDRAWQGAVPTGAAAFQLAVSGLGTIPGVIAGAVGTLGAISPYLGSRAEKRRSAAYLFLGLRRAEPKA